MPEKKVLIVDDSRLSLQMVQGFLEDTRPDWEVIAKDCPIKALDAALSEPPDLIIMDLNMPKMSGESLARQLRSDGISAPVCFLTANVQTPVKQRLEAEFGPVFNKPVNQALIDSLLEWADSQ